MKSLLILLALTLSSSAFAGTLENLLGEYQLDRVVQKSNEALSGDECSERLIFAAQDHQVGSPITEISVKTGNVKREFHRDDSFERINLGKQVTSGESRGGITQKKTNETTFDGQVLRRRFTARSYFLGIPAPARDADQGAKVELVGANTLFFSRFVDGKAPTFECQYRRVTQ